MGKVLVARGAARVEVQPELEELRRLLEVRRGGPGALGLKLALTLTLTLPLTLTCSRSAAVVPGPLCTTMRLPRSLSRRTCSMRSSTWLGSGLG